MDDVESVAESVRAGAERRGLRILEAVFPVGPTVVLRHESTSVEEALDIAQDALTPLISIDVTYFDAGEFCLAIEEPERGRPSELLQAAEERDGTADGLYVRWLVNGAVFLYIMVPEWRHELEAVRDQQRDDEVSQRQADLQAFRLRVTHLADQIERDPGYRAGTSHSRRSIGKAVLEPLLREDEDAFFVKLVLDRAGALARDHSAAVYAGLADQLAPLARQLRETDDWKGARRAGDRAAAVRAFLIERAEGYSPTTALVAELRRRAEER